MDLVSVGDASYISSISCSEGDDAKHYTKNCSHLQHKQVKELLQYRKTHRDLVIAISRRNGVITFSDLECIISFAAVVRIFRFN
jgi:hypothetical protein